MTPADRDARIVIINNMPAPPIGDDSAGMHENKSQI